MSRNLSDIVIDCKEISFVQKGYAVLEAITFQLYRGEALAVVGTSGAGKTTLGRSLAGKLKPTSGELVVSASRVVMVEQQDQFLSISGRGNTHYSQRYEAQDTSGLLSVDGYLHRVQKEIRAGDDDIKEVVQQTGIAHILDRKLLQLSNGERKRTQLAVALLRKPEMLVLDQPFVGLDVQSREKLSAILREMAKTAVVVVICGANQVPDFTDKVLELEKGKVREFTQRTAFKALPVKNNMALNGSLFSTLQVPPGRKVFDVVVDMIDVNVRLGGKHILKNVSWKVKRGEQWALTGHNGAGKTTLLSLITADNPQGYNNNLTLFDRRRGTGESIWDIKKEIGFVSSELHLYFLRGRGILNTIPGIDNGSREVYSTLSCLDVIVSGFNDEVGIVTEPSEYQLNIARHWLGILDLDRLEKSLFAHASLGEQRCILLARALVKFPSLLILDEPLQGLDDQQIAYFKALLNQICKTLGTTMIYVSHYNDEIPECVGHIIEISQGEVIRKEPAN
ncbi:ATP-binding cassette domain-containing protein [Sinomicrobium weinanense]|uniref:ATP-binding cassette domain-containing protein n=1 Tax=Sinomicrobium weinanense TaxID=2842200 RepID=A0A926JT66_9FLAO|nr:ATP-binding cassette domain-containing protein [Sinomicrobium weinanense]MBC9797045.1 ATP-binding cassette domain-containing protein [Sinomicrobium weinanense]MBU3122040.1 ATP-binding cassette domain-containing protein [Sinomicrobium weinanense]